MLQQPLVIVRHILLAASMNYRLCCRLNGIRNGQLTTELGQNTESLRMPDLAESQGSRSAAVGETLRIGQELGKESKVSVGPVTTEG